MRFDPNTAIVLYQPREIIVYQPIDFRALVAKQLLKGDQAQTALNEVKETFSPHAPKPQLNRNSQRPLSASQRQSVLNAAIQDIVTKAFEQCQHLYEPGRSVAQIYSSKL